MSRSDGSPIFFFFFLNAVIMFQRPAKWGEVHEVFFSNEILIHWAIMPPGTSWNTLDYLYSVYYSFFLGHLSPFSWLLRRIARPSVLGWTFMNYKREGSAPGSSRWGESQASWYRNVLIYLFFRFKNHSLHSRREMNLIQESEVSDESVRAVNAV